MLTDAQKVDVRRHCGYPVYGAEPGSNAGYRYFQAFGFLEFRMSNLTSGEEAVLTTTFLAILTTLEAAVPAAGANLDTDAAGVWTHNKNEVRDRMRLYDTWRRRLCGFMGIPPGPELEAGELRISV